mgnify:CR=1 FL=1
MIAALPNLPELLASARAPIAEPTRLRILLLLAGGELNVKDLTLILGQSQPRISRHLKLLCEAGLIERFRVWSPAPAGPQRVLLPMFGLGVFMMTRKQMLPYRATIRARSFDEFHGWVRHEGEEFLYVLTGVVRLFTEFYAPVDLRRGDSAYYDATMGHNVVSLSEEDGTVLWVTSLM